MKDELNSSCDDAVLAMMNLSFEAESVAGCSKTPSGCKRQAETPAASTGGNKRPRRLAGGSCDRFTAKLQRNAVRRSPRLVPNAGGAEPQRHPLDFHPQIRRLYAENRKISDLYEWQRECLSHPAVVSGRNLIISMPTSGGKTLVAEVLMLKQILLNNRDVLMILPYVSIVQEKIQSLEAFGLELDFLVEEYAGPRGRIPPIQRRKGKNSAYIATIERAYSLVSSLIQEKRVEQLGLVVVDELHMIGDGTSRGATLEQLLILLLTVSPTTQVVGMSATLSNIADLSEFLRAQLYENDFRPVQLTEMVKLGNFLYRVNQKKTSNSQEDLVKFCRNLGSSSQQTRDPDHLVPLVAEIIPKGSVLIFCHTKKNAENVAQLLSDLLPKDIINHKLDAKKKLFETLRLEGDGKVCQVLKKSLPFGIAYHHSGLTADERKLIQDAYLEGILSVLCCTSTLAAGVNLPAKRVILRNPLVGNQFISRQQYKQMTGRAGRAGLDAYGESIVIIQPNQKDKILDLFRNDFEECRSSLLADQGWGLKNLILSLIGTELAVSRVDLMKFVTASLAYIQRGRTLSTPNFDEFLDSLLLCLIAQGLIVPKKSPLEAPNSGSPEEVKPIISMNDFGVTPLGVATFKGNVDVTVSKSLLENLSLTLGSGIVLASHLHLLYCVVPYENVQEAKPDWEIFYNEFSKLGPNERRVFELVGVQEVHLVKKMVGGVMQNCPQLPVLCRLYLALILLRLWNQQPIWEVAEYFQMPRGHIQTLLQSTASFAHSVARFCAHLPQFWSLQTLLPTFVQQLSFCVKMELIPLMKIQGVKKGRAQQLYSAGYKTVASVAEADCATLMKQLEPLSKRQAKQIVVGAKMLLVESKEILMEQAEEILGGKSAAEFEFEMNKFLVAA